MYNWPCTKWHLHSFNWKLWFLTLQDAVYLNVLEYTVEIEIEYHWVFKINLRIKDDGEDRFLEQYTVVYQHLPLPKSWLSVVDRDWWLV